MQRSAVKVKKTVNLAGQSCFAVDLVEFLCLTLNLLLDDDVIAVAVSTDDVIKIDFLLGDVIIMYIYGQPVANDKVNITVDFRESFRFGQNCNCAGRLESTGGKMVKKLTVNLVFQFTVRSNRWRCSNTTATVQDRPSKYLPSITLHS